MDEFTKKIAFVLLSTFTIFLISGLAGAAPICSDTVCGEVTQPSGATTVSHDSDITIQFTVTYEGTSTPTTLNFDDTVNPSIGSWKTLPVNGTLINNEEPKNLNAVLSVPQGAIGQINDAAIIINTGTGASTTISVPALTIQESASLTAEKTQDLSQNQEGKFTVENTGNVALNNIEFSVSGNLDLVFSGASTPFSLSVGQLREISTAISDSSDIRFGFNPTTVTVTDTEEDVQDEVTFEVKKTFCDAGAVGGDLEITDFEVNNLGEGSDDEWELLDTVEVDVEVENTNDDDDVDDVFVELALFDSLGNDVTNDLEFENTDEEEIDLGNLRDNEEETVTFRFRVEADLEDGDYKLAVKAYSDDVGEENECIDESSDMSDDFFEAISILEKEDEEDFLAVDDVRVSPMEATCGETVDVTFNIINVGDEDIEDDRIRVHLVNTEMGISLSQDILRDLDRGDSTRASFTFVVPEGLENKVYSLRAFTEHDFSERSETFDIESVDTLIPLNVIGCEFTGGTGAETALITASLDSDARAGGEMVVRSIITSLLETREDFIISVSGHETWTEGSPEISHRILQLDPEESGEITITFNVNEGVEGTQSFVIEVRAGDNLETREVFVEFAGAGEPDGGFDFDFGDNALLWIIGIINVILIILIIIVAARISRREEE